MSDHEQDFSTRLHGLRTQELQGLRRVRDDASVVLHGGASGSWYFEWFEENYPGAIERHIGVEAFAARPHDLPENVEWIANTLGDMSAVATASVDMVFAGQVVEHLWPEDLAGFLAESHRVLRPGGTMVIDSPNRRVSEAIGWDHPEHTSELSVDEMSRFLAVAGFELEEIKGVLLGYDRQQHVFLDLEDERMSWEDRARLASDRAEDSFIWWLTARRLERDPDVGELRELTHAQADGFRSRRLHRVYSPLQAQREVSRIPHISGSEGYAGPLIYMPPSPCAAGRWHTSAVLRLEDARPTDGSPIARIEVLGTVDGVPGVEHGSRDIFAGDLDAGGAWTEVGFDFELPSMTMGLQTRVLAYGPVPVGAQMTIGLRQVQDVTMADPVRAQPVPVHVPEPRTVELLAMLKRRATAKAKKAMARN